MNKRWKVLLVDDVELFIELEKTFLQREDCTLLLARNGREALETIHRDLPDPVLLDLYMPEGDGNLVCHQVKNDPELRAIPILMVTYAGREKDRRRCEAAGCDGIRTKPINRHFFLAAVRNHLRIVERQAHRVPARILVRFGEDGGQILTDYSVNLSTSGLFPETRHSLPVGTKLVVSFTIAEHLSVLHCHARAAWVNEPESRAKPNLPRGVGIQFLDLAGSDQEKLQNLVQGRLLGPVR